MPIVIYVPIEKLQNIHLKHLGDKPNGPPYLKAYDISVIASSVSDSGLMAKVKSGSISGLAYKYVWLTKE